MDIYQLITAYFGAYGYAIVFFGSLLESLILVGFVVPGGVVVLLGGFFGRADGRSFFILTLLAFLGMFIGDVINYWLGKKSFRLLSSYARVAKRINARVAEGKKFISRYGAFAIFYSHIIGYLRSIICFSAGVTDFPLKHYIPVVAFSSFLWSIVFIGLGFFLNNSVEDIRDISQKIPLVGIGLLLILVGFRLIQNIFSYYLKQSAKKP